MSHSLLISLFIASSCSYNKHLVLPSSMQEAWRGTAMNGTQACVNFVVIGICCLNQRPGEAVPNHPL